MKIIKYNFISNDQRDYPFYEKIINYLFLVLSLIFFVVFNSMKYLNYNSTKLIKYLISTYEFVNLSIIFVIYMIFKVYYKKQFYNPSLLIPINYFFIITSISLNFTAILSIFDNNNNNDNKIIIIHNITCFRFFLLSGILNCLFILCITFLFLQKKSIIIFRIFVIFVIAYGSLSSNLFFFTDFDAYWPDIHYSYYILYSVILAMLFITYR